MSVSWLRVPAAYRHALGLWPHCFQEVKGGAWIYPHNFVLEAAFDWGWALALVAFTGLLAVILLSVRRAWQTRSIVDTSLAIIIFCFFLVMQLSGTYVDYVHILGLCWLWIVLAFPEETTTC